jgi:hypothetical protein
LVINPVGRINRFVTVPGTLLPQQVVTTGGSKVKAVPHCTVLFVGHWTCKQLQQPAMVTVWLQLVLLPQPSMSVQFCVIVSCGHVPLVIVPVDVMSTLVNTPVGSTIPLAQQVDAIGASNVQEVPQATVLLVGHCTTRHG